jgi:hypothetical protein
MSLELNDGWTFRSILQTVASELSSQKLRTRSEGPFHALAWVLSRTSCAAGSWHFARLESLHRNKTTCPLHNEFSKCL